MPKEGREEEASKASETSSIRRRPRTDDGGRTDQVEASRHMAEAESHGIVIVGGGICGLATALALHRKGIPSLVLEKSRSLRADGAGIGVHANGWRVLEQLGVAAELRETAQLITVYHDVWQQGDKTSREKVPVRMELRCLNRKDLIEALAKDIPAGAIRFGCRVAAVAADPGGGNGAVLTMADGTAMKAKVLIGCEGTYSAVARYLGLSPVRTIPRPVLRGFTWYPHGHSFDTEFLRLRVGGFFIGRLTITDNLDLKRVRDLALKDLQDVECPAEIIEIVRGSDPESLNLVTDFWYRPPWEVVLGSFQRGAVTVAGDAMHAMGPFIGQGGSAGLEDAVVLARSLARAAVDDSDNAREKKVVGEAIGEYVRERRPRLALLSLESFVMGALLVRSPSPVTKLVCVAVLILLGSKSLRHANYDCGRL
ncbi:FAD-dependent monooxygenase ctvC [Zea mays]|uniref:FAD-dependent monooxygenase ctvC n=1 Tax=Zea mays TaxID=4577 RepID=A0A3L6ESR0_MAIZE|nr:FAD-dependent monooxygenase ctvC [Zea mays]